MIATDVLLLIVLSAAGLAVWGEVARRRLFRERVLPPMPDERPPWNAGVVLVAAALWVFHLASRLFAEWQLLTDVAPQAPTVETVQGNVLSNTVLTALLLLLLSQLGRVSAVPFGIRGDRWRGDVAAGVLGFLAAMPAVFAVSLVTSPWRSEVRTHGLLQLLQKAPKAETYFWVGVSVVIAAPLFEELLFRVILQGALRSRLSAAAAIALSSAAFAFVHGFPDSLALLPLAVVLGYVFERRRSWLAVVVLHALFNASTLAMALLGQGA